MVKSFLLKMPCQDELIIETDCLDIASDLKLKFGKYFVETDRKLAASIQIMKSDKSFYIVSINQDVIRTQSPLFFIDRFLFEHPTYDANVLALHGAAVEWKGKGYVFLGATMEGKTTLTSYLIHCGCGYLTDDCVLLDYSSYTVHPFSMPLHLREGGLNVLRQYHALPLGLQSIHEGKASCRYIYAPPNCPEQAVPLGDIFFIERTKTENSFDPMTSTEKIAALMKSPITAYPITAEYLRLLADLSASFCKRLRYCDMNFMKEVIMKHAAQSST